jgi:hypothetical protein
MTRLDGEDTAAAPTPAGDDPPWGDHGAERSAEELAGRVAGWVARSVARAREEAEDVWAEAQDLRRRW